MNPKPFAKTLRSQFPGPAPRFDCLEEVRRHIGEAYWDNVIKGLSDYDCADCFRRGMFSGWGLEEFAVEVLYDHVKGQNAYAAAIDADQRRHMTEEYERGKEVGTFLKQTGLKADGVLLGDYDGPYPEDFKQGIEEACGLPTVG